MANLLKVFRPKKLMDELNLSCFYKNPTIPEIEVGDTIKITLYLELPKNQDAESTSGNPKKKGKERIQVYEGVVISKHRKVTQINSTITVRKMFPGGGVEKVFILNSPWLKNIQILRRAKIKRAKLYYLRELTGKSARLKAKI